jgi:hypothetical protein
MISPYMPMNSLPLFKLLRKCEVGKYTPEEQDALWKALTNNHRLIENLWDINILYSLTVTVQQKQCNTSVAEVLPRYL